MQQVIEKSERHILGRNAVDVLVDKLIEQGVKRIYGIPGDSINTLLDSIRRHEKKIDFILVRHEEVAALIAASEAKLTEKLSVCVGTSGPGAIHLTNGLYEAKMEHVPVLAVTGQMESDLVGTDYFQEVNLVRLFDDVALYNKVVMSAEHVGVLVSTAIRTSLSEKGVSHLNFPLDVARQGVPENFRDSPIHYWEAVGVPPADDIEFAAETLNKGRKIIILAGKGSRGARESVIQLAEKLNAPIIKTLLGKDVIPDEHPFCLGGIGLLGTRPAQDAMEECDTLLMVGTSYPYTWFLPKNARVIQIDNRPTQLGKRYHVNVPLIGDSNLTLEALIPKIKEHEDNSFLKKYQRAMASWWQKMDSEENSNDTPIKPQRLAKEIEKAAEENAVISVDVGNVTVWMARNFRIKKNQRMIFSGWLGTMGVGFPGGLAAKFVYPERQVIAAAGDGGFAMTMADFITAVRYKLPVIVVIFNNGKLGMIKFEEEVQGHPDYGTDLVNPDFAKYAEACGGLGITVGQPSEIRPALTQAFQSNKPSVVNVGVNPNERPMPPKVTLKQAKGYVTSLFKEKFDL
jgi:pyruvate oxidase